MCRTRMALAAEPADPDQWTRPHALRFPPLRSELQSASPRGTARLGWSVGATGDHLQRDP